MASPILVIVNPNAYGSRAGRIFENVRVRLEKSFGELIVVVSRTPSDLSGHIEAAIEAGAERIIACGGDGTNHAVVNSLFSLADERRSRLTLGSLPVGTGSDWARALGMPLDADSAIDWLTRAHPVACDVGLAELLGPQESRLGRQRFFLNIASAGVSGEVDQRVNRARQRSSATFLRATIATLLKYKPQPIRVFCDGQIFYEGPSYLLAVANGRCFGRGMWVAPHALIDDGQFDVILVEGMPRRRILLALKTVYSGTHLSRSYVHSIRAASVQVNSMIGPLSLDFDGEEAQGQSLQFKILPQALKILIHPAARNVLKKPDRFTG